jgi:mannose-1-phosphate guanylyltransferase
VNAMLLCAGLGTRLRPLTLERPKPLVPLLGRPLAAWALDRLATVGVRSVVANTFHLGAQIEPALAPFAAGHGMTLACVHEKELLGTGGGIRNALPRLGQDPFVVFNGDVLSAPNLERALSLHERSGARMTMVLREDPDAERLGAIDVDADGRVRRILGEGAAPPVPVRRCMFTGVYVLSADIEEDLPEQGCIVRHSLRRWLARGDRVSAIVDDGPWHDLGTIRSYAEVTFGLLDGTIPFDGFTPPSGARWIDPSAEISRDVTVGARAFVGAGAQVVGEGSLERTIVWEGARMTEPCRDVIVTTGGERVPIL